MQAAGKHAALDENKLVPRLVACLNLRFAMCEEIATA